MKRKVFLIIFMIFIVLMSMANISFADSPLCKATGSHSYNDATCTKPKTCKRVGCGATSGKALGHDYSKYQSSYYSKISKADTCRSLYYKYKCSRCPSTTSKLQSTDYNHNITGKVTTQPTCTTMGTTTYSCSDCNYSYTKQDVPIDPDNHSIDYKYVDSSLHLVYCTRNCTTHKSYNEGHTIAGGVGNTVHYCTVCGVKAGEKAGCTWSNLHYFPGGYGDVCDSEACKAQLTITTTNISSSGLPVMGDYYMMGAGGNKATSWEKSFNKVTVEFNYPPYKDRNKGMHTITYTAEGFTHGNWVQHAKSWADSINESSMDNILVWPNDNIQEPLKNWGQKSGAYLKGTWINNGTTDKHTLNKVSDTKFESGTLANGHWMTSSIALSGKDSGVYYNYIYVNGTCNGSTPTPIPARVRIAYRDVRDGSTITGAPSDSTDMNTIVWINGPTGNKFSKTANHDTLDKYGWRYVGYQVYNQFSVPDASTIAGRGIQYTGDTASCKPSLGDQKYVIVFLYEPIKLHIEHKNITTNSKIRTDKNGSLYLYELISCYENPNHVCSTLGCGPQAPGGKPNEGQGMHQVTSLHKVIWPGYILENYTLTNSSGSFFAYRYDIEEHNGDSHDPYPENATTRIPGINTSEEEAKNIVQKKIPVSTTLVTNESKGHKSDITITFNYLNIGVHVSHHNINGDILKDISGLVNLEYDMTLNGHAFVIPSLNSVGKNRFIYAGENGVDYDITGKVLKKVEVYKGGKLVGDPISISDESFYWLFSSSDLLLQSYVNEIKKVGNDVSIKFYYESIPILTVEHRTDKGELKGSEVIRMNSGDVWVIPKTFTGYTDSCYIDENGGSNPPPYAGGGFNVVNDGRNKTVIFVYKPEDIYIVAEQGEKKALLRSNEREDTETLKEEYNVEQAIPTSEDLYANVITNPAEIRDIVTLKNDEKPSLRVKIIRQYYDRNDTDSKNKEGNFEIGDRVFAREAEIVLEKIPFQYYSGVDAKLDILSKAVFQNNAILSKEDGTTIYGEATVTADFDGKEPYLEFTKGGKWVPGVVHDARALTDLFSETGKESPVTAGFYEPRYDSNGDLDSITLVLSEVDYFKPNISQIANKYKDDITLFLAEAALYNMQVTLDKLSVYIWDYENNTGFKEYKIYNGGRIALNKRVTLDEMIRTGAVDLETFAGVLIGKDVLYRNEGIFVNAGGLNAEGKIENITNDVYRTLANIYYKEHQKIGSGDYQIISGSGVTSEVAEETLLGNNVYVQTPVVNGSELNLTINNAKHNQAINNAPATTKINIKDANGSAEEKELQSKTVVLGEEFDVVIPHNGNHIGKDGYGNKAYNYEGLYKSDDDEDWYKETSFAREKLVRFGFDVVYRNLDSTKEFKYDAGKNKWEAKMKDNSGFDMVIENSATDYIRFPANQWISLPLNITNYTFTIPTWVEEKWKGQPKDIDIMVVAENTPEIDNYDSVLNYGEMNSSDIAQWGANTYVGNVSLDENGNLVFDEYGISKRDSTYIAIGKIPVEIIGKMYDLQIRATNDPGWANFTGNAPLKVEKFPVGQANQNPTSGYKYGLKLGTKVFFDLKVDGSTGETSDNIIAKPKYYYVSKTGSNREVMEVDLYYHTLTERFINMGTKPIDLDTKMTQNNGDKYFANYSTNLGLTGRILTENGKSFNYTAFNNIGNSSQIILNNLTRIVAYRNSLELIKAKFGNSVTQIENVPGGSGTFPTENQVINSIGRWYGEFRIPASTVVVRKGADPKQATNVLKNGYVIVVFESLITQSNGVDYLSYSLPVGNDQWKKEGYKDTYEIFLANGTKEIKEGQKIQLPNGQIAIVPKEYGHAMAIYETDVRINNDYETTGTH